MEKKEFPKQKGTPKEPLIKKPNVSGKLNEAFGWVGDCLKFFIGVALIPFAYSFSVSFLNEFSVVNKALQNSFWFGALTMLAVYLFVWEPAPVYAFGQKILEAIFGFFAPLVKVAPFLLPIYVIILFSIYGVVSVMIDSDALLGYFLYLIGVGMALHLVFSAKTLRTRKSDPLKSAYIFGFGFVYIASVLLLALCLSLVFVNFSFVRFFTAGFGSAKVIFSAVFRQLFVV